MRLLLISDGHGNLEMLDKLDAEFKKADCVLFAGDFAKFGEPETGLPFFNKLMEKHEKIYSVLGNCDEESFGERIENADISVVNALLFSEGLVFTGSSGGSKFTGTTPFEREEEELVHDLHLVTESENSDWNNLVAIMHNPPKDTNCDKIDNGMHVGSALLKEWIEKYQPLLVLTGHIHESKGIDEVGKTTVVNPGALCEGNYAVAEVVKSEGNWKIKSCELLSL